MEVNIGGMASLPYQEKQVRLPAVPTEEQLVRLEAVPPKVGHGSGKIVLPSNYIDKNMFIDISYNGHLPHWDQPGKLQFVTFRLADSLPQSKLKEFQQLKEEWLKEHPFPWKENDFKEYNDFCEVFEDWLDLGFGSCILKYKEIQTIVENSILHFDNERYVLFDYIIMPNHVHLLLITGLKYSMKQIMHSIKSFSANEINKLLNRKGEVWQKSSFDSIMRNAIDYQNKKEYIMHNGDYL